METVDVISALPLPPRTPDFLFSVFKKKNAYVCVFVLNPEITCVFPSCASTQRILLMSVSGLGRFGWAWEVMGSPQLFLSW